MFNLILAHDLNNGIGKNNAIPWHFSEDMNYFKKLTTLNLYDDKNIVIMGRKTHQSIPNNFLKDRINIVISKTVKGTIKNNLYYIDNFENALEFANNLNKRNTKKIWIIGGATIYNIALKHRELNKIYRTLVNQNLILC